VISDLTTASLSSSSNTKSIASTSSDAFPYIAPEVLLAESCISKVHVWELGCTIHELCALKSPFASSSVPDLRNNISTLKRRPIPPNYSRELTQLISSCLETDSSKRPSTEELRKKWKEKWEASPSWFRTETFYRPERTNAFHARYSQCGLPAGVGVEPYATHNVAKHPNTEVTDTHQAVHQQVHDEWVLQQSKSRVLIPSDILITDIGSTIQLQLQNRGLIHNHPGPRHGQPEDSAMTTLYCSEGALEQAFTSEQVRIWINSWRASK
jgi:serine/threonine protein kinase